MISNIVRLAAKPDRIDTVRALLERLVARTRAEPGTLIYNLHVDNSDGSVFWIYELYADEAALRVHTSADGFAELLTEVRGELREDLSVTRTAALRTEVTAT